MHSLFSCMAVSSAHQGEALMNDIVTHLMKVQAERGNYHLFLYTKCDSARFFATKQDKEMSETVHTSVLFALISGVSMALIGIFLARTLLTLMDTPDNVIDQSVLYMLKVTFSLLLHSIIWFIILHIHYK